MSISRRRVAAIALVFTIALGAMFIPARRATASTGSQNTLYITLGGAVLGLAAYWIKTLHDTQGVQNQAIATDNLLKPLRDSVMDRLQVVVKVDGSGKHSFDAATMTDYVALQATWNPFVFDANAPTVTGGSSEDCGQKTSGLRSPSDVYSQIICKSLDAATQTADASTITNTLKPAVSAFVSPPRIFALTPGAPAPTPAPLADCAKIIGDTGTTVYTDGVTCVADLVAAIDSQQQAKLQNLGCSFFVYDSLPNLDTIAKFLDATPGANLKTATFLTCTPGNVPSLTAAAALNQPGGGAPAPTTTQH